MLYLFTLCLLCLALGVYVTCKRHRDVNPVTVLSVLGVVFAVVFVAVCAPGCNTTKGPDGSVVTSIDPVALSATMAFMETALTAYEKNKAESNATEAANQRTKAEQQLVILQTILSKLNTGTVPPGTATAKLVDDLKGKIEEAKIKLVVTDIATPEQLKTLKQLPDATGSK